MAEISLYLWPDPDEPDGAIVFVPVAIAGRQYRFLLDTGASVSEILADQHSAAFPRVGSTQSSGLFNSEPRDLVTVSDLQMGALHIDQIVMTLIEEEGPEVFNILGMDVLGRSAYRLNLGDQKLQQLADGAAGPHSMTRDDAGHLFIDIRWPGASATACFDTGAAMTVVSDVFVSEHPGLFTPCGVSVGRGNDGVEVQTPMYTTAPYQVSGVDFASHRVAAIPLPATDVAFDAIVGYPTLRQAIWDLDFPANQWALRPASG